MRCPKVHFTALFKHRTRRKMKDDMQTDLGKNIYKYAPVSKVDIDLDTLDDIANAFCVREGYKYRGYMHIDTVLWVIIGINLADESMSMYTEFKKSFEAHGYSAPRLCLESIGDEKIA
jgi:hypothetical protein